MPTRYKKAKKVVKESQAVLARAKAEAEIERIATELAQQITNDAQVMPSVPGPEALQPSIEVPNTQPVLGGPEMPWSAPAQLAIGSELGATPTSTQQLATGSGSNVQVKQILTDFIIANRQSTSGPERSPYHWDTEHTAILLRAKIVCLSKGWTTTKAVFTTRTNKVIQEAFEQAGKRVPNPAQIKNRLDTLRKLYTEYTSILNRSGEPFRYNEVTASIEADPEIWERTRVSEPAVAKWEFQQIICKDEIDQVFAKRTASGAYATGREDIDPNIDPALQEDVTAAGRRETSMSETSGALDEVLGSSSQSNTTSSQSKKRSMSVAQSPARRNRSDIGELVSLLRFKVESDGAAAREQANDRRKAFDVLNDICADLEWPVTRKIKAWKLLESSLHVDIVLTQTAEELAVWLEEEIPEE